MRHRRCVSALVVGAFLGACGIASAADIPLKALPPPVPLFVWTGAYGGANVGYSWGSSVATVDIPVLATLAPPLPTTDSYGVAHRGWEASVEGGYCYQPGRDRDSNFVACLEVRYDFPAERSATSYFGVPTTPATPVVTTTHIDPLLIGPHLGFTTNANSTLWYAAGGLAVGQVGGGVTGITTPGTGTPSANPASAWVTGWFLGAGVEQMLNSNWGLKVEYDYVQLDTGGLTAPFTGGAPNLTIFSYTGFPATATVAGHPYDNVVTAGINYHFH
jgi:outer membrane immunogenic protein